MLNQPPDVVALESRIEALEEELARVDERLTRQRTPEPSLMGLRPEGARDAAPSERVQAGGGAASLTANEAGGALAAATEAKAELASLVEEAVEKKAAQMRTMQNKKPSLDAFASTLELSDEQRAAAADGVVRSQGEIRDILMQPTEDGTVFYDELVEILAGNMAAPQKTAQRAQKFWARLFSEKVPGTDQTYVQRAEAVKQRLRDQFKRDWDDEQYARFEQWQMDPTEVQDVPGSPWKELEQRVVDRAKQMGWNDPREK